ncbi:MAG: hypothetical protein Q9184_003564 [Pyrenodesmia sp. 2 TL-2023]
MIYQRGLGHYKLTCLPVKLANFDLALVFLYYLSSLEYALENLDPIPDGSSCFMILVYLVVIGKFLALSIGALSTTHGLEHGIKTPCALGRHRVGLVQSYRSDTDAKARLNVQGDNTGIDANSAATVYQHPYLHNREPTLVVHQLCQPSFNYITPWPQAANINKTCPVDELIIVLSSYHITPPTIRLPSLVLSPSSGPQKSEIKGLLHNTTPLPPVTKDGKTFSVHDLIELLSSYHITAPSTPLAHATSSPRTHSAKPKTRGVLSDFVYISQKFAVEDLIMRFASWSIAICQEPSTDDSQPSRPRACGRLPRNRGLMAVFPNWKNRRIIKKQKAGGADSKPSSAAAQHVAPKLSPSTFLAASTANDHQAPPEPATKPQSAIPSNTCNMKPSLSTPLAISTAIDYQARPEPATKPHSAIPSDTCNTKPTPSTPTTGSTTADHQAPQQPPSRLDPSASSETATTSPLHTEGLRTARVNSAPPPVQKNNPTQSTHLSTSQQTPYASPSEDKISFPAAKINAMVAQLETQLSLLSLLPAKRTNGTQDAKVRAEGSFAGPTSESISRHFILPGIYSFTNSWYTPSTEESLSSPSTLSSGLNTNVLKGSVARLFEPAGPSAAPLNSTCSVEAVGWMSRHEQDLYTGKDIPDSDAEMSGDQSATFPEDDMVNGMDIETGSDTTVSDTEMAGYQTPASSEDDSENEMDVDEHTQRPERSPGNSCRLVRLRRSPQPRTSDPPMDRVIAGLPVKWEKQPILRRQKGEGRRERVTPTNPKLLPWQQSTYWSESTAALRERKMSGARTPPR